MADKPTYPGTPRWVKVSGIVAGVVAVTIVILLLAGGGLGRHGPGRHMPSADSGGQQPAFRVAERAIPSGGGVLACATAEGRDG